MLVADLDGVLLDYWVARSLGYSSVQDLERRSDLCVVKCDGWQTKDWAPSRDWDQGGALIEREGISVMRWETPNDAGMSWTARNLRSDVHADGSTPLIAAMRVYVASKFGDEVDDAQPGSVG